MTKKQGSKRDLHVCNNPREYGPAQPIDHGWFAMLCKEIGIRVRGLVWHFVHISVFHGLGTRANCNSELHNFVQNPTVDGIDHLSCVGCRTLTSAGGMRSKMLVVFHICRT
jgi:hypothetical protein